MSINLRDMMLTAYVLDELDASERSDVEKQLRDDTEARAFVDELREVIERVSASFDAEARSDEGLSELHRLAIEQRLQEMARPAEGSAEPMTRPQRWAWTGLSVAASVAVAACIALAAYVAQWSGDVTQVDEVAIVDSSRNFGDGIGLSYGDMTFKNGIGWDDGHATSRLALRELPDIHGDVAPRDPGPWGSLSERRHDRYAAVTHNPFLQATANPLSTFSIDVDTASYTNVRRTINDGQLPEAGSVRIEEFINYFSYDYDPPAADSDRPFAVHTDVSDAPWRPKHRLVRIGLKAKEMPAEDRPAANLVFLIDTSGSMDNPDKLPLLKRSLKLMLDELTDKDRVAIVTYAGNAGVACESTSVRNRPTLHAVIDGLGAGGSTNGEGGINVAYDLAKANYIKDGVNRVILATDGDFNVGASDDSSLVALIEEKAKSGVYLSVLGFGRGNLNDQMLEQITGKGNGQYAYIDTVFEAQKALVEQAGGSIVAVARDVKIQVEFNPRKVAAYRLIGYENRVMANRDFNDDTKDAGDIGAGHTVTALYEIVPAGEAVPDVAETELKYQRPAQLTDAARSDELLTVRLRYKTPDVKKSNESKLLQLAVRDGGKTIQDASHDFRFAAATAAFGMILRESPHRGSASFDGVLALAEGFDAESLDLSHAERSRRAEFVDLVRRAATLRG